MNYYNFNDFTPNMNMDDVEMGNDYQSVDDDNDKMKRLDKYGIMIYYIFCTLLLAFIFFFYKL